MSRPSKWRRSRYIGSQHDAPCTSVLLKRFAARRRPPPAQRRRRSTIPRCDRLLRLPGAEDPWRRVTHGRSEVTDPWDIVRLNLDARTDGYVGEELYKAPGFGSGVTLESADFLLGVHPGASWAGSRRARC